MAVEPGCPILHVQGSGFDAGEAVLLEVMSPTPGTVALAGVEANKAGAFEIDKKMPVAAFEGGKCNYPEGLYSIVATAANGGKASALLKVVKKG